MSRAARGASPELPVIWSGPHVVVDPGSCLETGAVDACAPGAGEEPLQGAVEALRSGRPLASVPGLLVAGAAAVAPTPPPTQLWPRALYSLLDVERYFEERGARRLDYASSRGVREIGLAGTAAGACRGRGARAGRPLPGRRVVLQGPGLLRRSGPRGGDRRGAARGRRAAWLARRSAGWGRAGCRARDAAAAGRGRMPGPASSARATSAASGCSRPAPGSAARGSSGVSSSRWPSRPGPARASRAPSPRRARCARWTAASRRRSTSGSLRPRRLRPAARSRSGRGSKGSRGATGSPSGGSRARPSYFAEAQRAPGRRLGKHLLRVLALLRVRLGFFSLDFEKVAVELSALVRTGRPRPEAGE